MDISQWLENTELPEAPPSLPEQLGLPPFLHRKQGIKEPTLNDRPRPKRALTDSSLLEAQAATRIESSAHHARDVAEDSHHSLSSNASDSPDQHSDSSASSHRYARRVRRKTRLERYEPKSTEGGARGKHNRTKRKDESRKAGKGSKRRKNDNPGAAIVQTFRAKNVPKDRLTLKPRENLGLFNKGRASRPVKGRGLPDLVFSEMKFLQKKDPLDELDETETHKKRRKKDPSQAKEEEISAYFTSVRPALEERSGNSQAGPNPHPRKTLVLDSDNRHLRPTHTDSPVPLVDLRGKPFLGCGSRGPTHDSSTYLPWSDSVRAPSEPSRPRPLAATVLVGQRGRSESRQNITAHRGDTSRTLTKEKARKNRSDNNDDDRDRVQTSLPLPSHDDSDRRSVPHRSAPIKPTHIPRDNTTVKRSSSMSVSNSKTRKGVQHPEPSRSDSANPMQSSMSPVPYIHKDIKSDMPEQGAEGETGPDTPSTLGRLLRECDSVFAPKRGDRPQPSTRTVHKQASGIVANEPRVAWTEPHAAGYQHHDHLLNRPPRPTLPMLERPSLYEEQARRVSFVDDPEVFEEENVVPYASEEVGEEEQRVWSDNYHDAESMMPDESACFESEISDGLEFAFAAEARATSVEERIYDIPQGFWRPHRLY